MSTAQTLNRAQTLALIRAIGATRTVLVEGQAGHGKTSLLSELAVDAAFADHIVVPPVNCTELADGSVWMPDIDRCRGVALEVPNERFGISPENCAGVAGARPVLIFLDEMAKARQSVKDTLAPLVLDRMIGKYKLPKGSVVVICSNLSDEGLGDQWQGHMINRFTRIRLHMQAPEWLSWASGAGIHPAVASAVHQYPQCFESFTDYREGGAKAGQSLRKNNPYIYDPSDPDQDSYVSPRSLHAASDILKARSGLDEHTLIAALSGTVGPAFAAVIMTALRFTDATASWQDILDNPDTTPVPANPSVQIVTLFKCLANAKSSSDAESVSRYFVRFPEETQVIFMRTAQGSAKKFIHFAASATFNNLQVNLRRYLG